MSANWSEILNACAAMLHSDGFAAGLDAGRPAGMVLLGLVAGATHCSAMCGPFVLSQVGSRLANVPLEQSTRLSRLQGAALVPYHAGRITTYTALGAAAAGLAGGAQAMLLKGYAPATLLGVAGLLLVTYAALKLLPRPAVAGNAGGRLQGWWHGWLQPLFRQPTGWNGYLIGIVLGFLPCGLLYSALLLAGASADWRDGALGMAAFAAGTVPALLVVGYLGTAAGARWRNALRRWLPLVIGFNGLVLLAMAARWLVA